MTVGTELALETTDDLDSLRREWTALADLGGELFTTWEWASTWWRHFGAGREPLVTACRAADGTATALLPLYVAETEPARTLRLVGGREADQLGPVCAPADRALALDALHRVLERGIGDWERLVVDRVPPDIGWHEAMGGQVVKHELSPAIDIDGATWEEYLASRSRNLREQVRRRERRLKRDHEVTYRLSDDPDRLGDDFDTMLRLHRARWGRSSSFEGPREAFHRDFAARALEQGWLRLWTMELGGAPAAAWLGYRFGAREWYYQAGRDPALDRYAVGFVLLVHTIREAIGDGMRQYRLLLGGEPYKYRFATADAGVFTVALRRSDEQR